MIKLDLKDRKLLYELDSNSRQSVQQLAKKVSLSKDAVKYRINRFLKLGIIKSFNAVIDTGRLGYMSFRLLIKFYSLSPDKEKDILSFLEKNRNLVWYVQAEGGWDINTWCLYRSINEMDAFWKEFLEKYNNYIERREFAIYTNVTYFGRTNLVKKRGNRSSTQIISLPKEAKVDEVDFKIINILSENARTPIIDIAKMLDVASKTVIARMKKLEKERIIVAYRAEFDLEKLGLRYYKIHISTFNASVKDIEQLKNYAYQNMDVVYVDEVLGGYDIEIEIQVEDENELRKLINDIREKFSNMIKNYDVLHYYKEHRLRFFPA